MAKNPLIKRYLDAGMAFTQMTQARAEAIVADGDADITRTWGGSRAVLVGPSFLVYE